MHTDFSGGFATERRIAVDVHCSSASQCMSHAHSPKTTSTMICFRLQTVSTQSWKCGHRKNSYTCTRESVRACTCIVTYRYPPDKGDCYRFLLCPCTNGRCVPAGNVTALHLIRSTRQHTCSWMSRRDTYMERRGAIWNGTPHLSRQN